MRQLTYLDWAATAPPEREILTRALGASMESYGNPSSQHCEGKTSKKLLEGAREGLVGSIFPSSPAKVPSGSLAFTGSGTEADQIVLLSLLRRLRSGDEQSFSALSGKKPHLIVSAIEHAAVHAQSEILARMGFAVSYVKPDEDGIVSPQKIAAEMRPSTRLVAVMAVNNETGSIQDISAIGLAIVAASSAGKTPPPLFHVDCVQALGKISLDIPGSRATSAAFSAHKIRGPRGIGALWTAKTLEPLALGGGQEGGVRSGTENLFGALAFSLCAEKAAAAADANFAHACDLEKRLLEGLGKIPGASALPQSRVGRDARWSPWILSAAFPGLGGEVLVRALSDAGICVTTGAACSQAGKTKGRRILDAMGVSEELSFSAVRISVGPTTTKQEIDVFLETADDLYRRLKT